MTDLADPQISTPQPPPAQPRSTSVLAILALVFGFLAPVVGVVLGIIALVKLRTKEKTGRGLAIAGLIIGILGTIGWLLLLATGALFAAAAADTSGNSAASDIVADVTQDLGVHLNVGECTGAIPTGEVSSVETIDCAKSHNFEVYSKFALVGAPGTEFPGVDKVNADAEAGCVAAFDGFVGLGYQESQYSVTFITPTQKTWNAGDDRDVACLLADPAGQMAGSAQGSAR